MTFQEAMQAVFEDSEYVTRQVWNSRQTYLLLEEGKLQIRGGVSLATGKPDTDGIPHPYTLDEQDYFGTDWEIVGEN